MEVNHKHFMTCNVITRTEARKLGLTQYFTGKPCPHGHIYRRLTSNRACLRCENIRGSKPEVWRKKYKIRYAKHREEILRRQKVKKRTPEFRKKINEYKRKLYKENIEYRLNSVLSKSLRVQLKKNSLTKNNRLINLVGCTLSELRQHFERQFTGRMSWNNYGRLWHIDHIRPCSSFNLADSDEQKACYHFTNLRPLLVRKNIAKGGRRELLL